MDFDHIAIKSSNIQRSVDWYSDCLGCKIDYSDSTWAMMDCNGTKIALVKGDSHPPHIAFKVKSSIKFPCDESLVKTHRDKSSYYYGSDPDGNIIEWIAYTHEEE